MSAGFFRCLVYLMLPSENGWLASSHKVFCPFLGGSYRERKFELVFS